MWCKNVMLVSILFKFGVRLSGNVLFLCEVVGKFDVELLCFFFVVGVDFKEDGEYVFNWVVEVNFVDIVVFLCVIDDLNMFDRGKVS